MCNKCERTSCICLGPLRTDAIVSSYTKQLEQALLLRNVHHKEVQEIVDVLWELDQWTKFKDVKDIAKTVSKALCLTWKYRVS